MTFVGQRLWEGKLVAGLLAVVLGGIVLAWPGPSILVASALFGESELPGRGWYVAAGIVSVIAGLVVLVWPFESIAVLTLATGIWLIIIGIAQVIEAFQTRKAANTARHATDESVELAQPRPE